MSRLLAYLSLPRALDHGIESSEDRIAAGKTLPARLALRTYQQKTGLVVEIESKLHEGTLIRFTFPPSALDTDWVEPLIQAS